MLNMVALNGYLTKDVEIKKTTGGHSVARFTIGVKRDASDKTDFITCIAWDGAAEFLGKYAKKGHLISVAGSLQVRNYEKDGHTVYVTEVKANSVKDLTKREASATGTADDEVIIDEEDDPF